MSFQHHFERVSAGLSALSDRQQIAVAAAACQRMSAVYVEFSRRTGFGSESLYRRGVDALWSYAGGQPLDDGLLDVHDKLIGIVPTPDMYPELGYFGASEAGGALLDAVGSLLGDGVLRGVVSVLQAPLDIISAAMEARAIRNELEPPSLEAQWMAEPARAEAERQLNDIKVLGEQLSDKLLEQVKSIYASTASSTFGVPVLV
jgi:uncharacterized protein YjaG (DUF416 family)